MSSYSPSLGLLVECRLTPYWRQLTFNHDIFLMIHCKLMGLGKPLSEKAGIVFQQWSHGKDAAPPTGGPDHTSTLESEHCSIVLWFSLEYKEVLYWLPQYGYSTEILATLDYHQKAHDPTLTKPRRKELLIMFPHPLASSTSPPRTGETVGGDHCSLISYLQDRTCGATSLGVWTASSLLSPLSSIPFGA